MGGSESTSSPRRWNAACLLAPAERDGDAARTSVAELRASLSRRGLTVRDCANYHEVMADVALHERGRKRGGASEPLVVVLVEPDPRGAAAVLFDAVLRHAPSTVFWELGCGATPRLTAFRPEAAAPIRNEPIEEVSPPIVARGAAPARPALRLAGEGAEDREEGSVPARAGAGASLLSEEELAMLLGEGPDLLDPGGARA